MRMHRNLGLFKLELRRQPLIGTVPVHYLLAQRQRFTTDLVHQEQLLFNTKRTHQNLSGAKARYKTG